MTNMNTIIIPRTCQYKKGAPCSPWSESSVEGTYEQRQAVQARLCQA